MSFESLDGDIAGLFDAPGRIVVSTSVRPTEVPVVVRHELCHALDHVEGLALDAHAALDPLAEQMTIELDDNPAFSSPAGRRGEVVARLCELEPLALASLQGGCPGEVDLEEAARWVSDVVWSRYDARRYAVELGDVVRADWPVGVVEQVQLGATDSADVVELQAQTANSTGWGASLRDRWSGESTEVDAHPIDGASEVPPGAPMGARSFGWIDGPAWAAWVSQLSAWSSTVGRTFVWTGEQWSIDEGR